jgi:hypothetical protein
MHRAALGPSAEWKVMFSYLVSTRLKSCPYGVYRSGIGIRDWGFGGLRSKGKNATESAKVALQDAETGDECNFTDCFVCYF